MSIYMYEICVYIDVSLYIILLVFWYCECMHVCLLLFMLLCCIIVYMYVCVYICRHVCGLCMYLCIYIYISGLCLCMHVTL